MRLSESSSKDTIMLSLTLEPSTNLRAFNHPQPLKGLKEEVKIGCLWYNLRSLAIRAAQNRVRIGFESTRLDFGLIGSKKTHSNST